MPKLPTKKILSNLTEMMDRMEAEHDRLIASVHKARVPQSMQWRLVELEQGLEVAEAIHQWLLMRDYLASAALLSDRDFSGNS